MINDIKEGDKVTGQVQQVEDKQVVVHINGGKFNGIIPISQLSTHHIDSPSEVVKEANEVEAYVTNEFDEENETGAYILSRRQLETEKSYSYLQEKLDNNEIIQAKVTEVVKGGLVVDVGQRGFVPRFTHQLQTSLRISLCLMDKQFVLKLKNWILENNSQI